MRIETYDDGSILSKINRDTFYRLKEYMGDTFERVFIHECETNIYNIDIFYKRFEESLQLCRAYGKNFKEGSRVIDSASLRSSLEGTIVFPGPKIIDNYYILWKDFESYHRLGWEKDKILQIKQVTCGYYSYYDNDTKRIYVRWDDGGFSPHYIYKDFPTSLEPVYDSKERKEMIEFEEINGLLC